MLFDSPLIVMLVFGIGLAFILGALAHRLDRETSGCLVLGRHRKALANLSDLFRYGTGGRMQSTAFDQSGAMSDFRFASRSGFVIATLAKRFALFPGSSVVEQPAVNRLVAGSNPARGAIPHQTTHHQIQNLSV